MSYSDRKIAAENSCHEQRAMNNVPLTAGCHMIRQKHELISVNIMG